MKKIFQQAKDKNVAAVLIYVDTNGYACADSTFENKLSKEELKDAFLKRSFVVVSGDYIVPTQMEIEDGYIAITAGLTTVYSSEYEEPAEAEPAASGGGSEEPPAGGSDGGGSDGGTTTEPSNP